VVRFFLIF